MARASAVHMPPPHDSPWEQPGALSQFGSRKLHFALTQMGVGKSRGLEPVPAAWSPPPPPDSANS